MQGVRVDAVFRECAGKGDGVGAQRLDLCVKECVFRVRGELEDIVAGNDYMPGVRTRRAVGSKGLTGFVFMASKDSEPR